MADCGFSQHGDMGVGGLTFFSAVCFDGLSLLGIFASKSPVVFTLKKNMFKFDMKIKVVAKSTFWGWTGWFSPMQPLLRCGAYR